MRTKPYKFEDKPTEIWFTGCTHIFHNREFIWQKRGYKSIEDHAKAVQEKINSLVQPHHILFHLGDGFLNSTPQKAKEWLVGLNVHRIYYVTGNHESATGQLYRAAKQDKGIAEGYEVYPLDYLNLTFVGPQVLVAVKNRFMTLTHFPMAVWDSSHHGAWNIHSHNHGSYPESLPEHREFKRLDVGWDVFHRPVSLLEIDEIMARKAVKIVDHHNSHTT